MFFRSSERALFTSSVSVLLPSSVGPTRGALHKFRRNTPYEFRRDALYEFRRDDITSSEVNEFIRLQVTPRKFRSGAEHKFRNIVLMCCSL